MASFRYKPCPSYLSGVMSEVLRMLDLLSQRVLPTVCLWQRGQMCPPRYLSLCFLPSTGQSQPAVALWF